jgi:hypothetical protein
MAGNPTYSRGEALEEPSRYTSERGLAPTNLHSLEGLTRIPRIRIDRMMPGNPTYSRGEALEEPSRYTSERGLAPYKSTQMGLRYGLFVVRFGSLAPYKSTQMGGIGADFTDSHQTRPK